MLVPSLKILGMSEPQTPQPSTLSSNCSPTGLGIETASVVNSPMRWSLHAFIVPSWYADGERYREKSICASFPSFEVVVARSQSPSRTEWGGLLLEQPLDAYGVVRGYDPDFNFHALGNELPEDLSFLG